MFIDNIDALKKDVFNTELDHDYCDLDECIHTEETYDKEEVDKLIEEYDKTIKHLRKKGERK